MAVTSRLKKHTGSSLVFGPNLWVNRAASQDSMTLGLTHRLEGKTERINSISQQGRPTAGTGGTALPLGCAALAKGGAAAAAAGTQERTRVF